jgi:hypothetical protein
MLGNGPDDPAISSILFHLSRMVPLSTLEQSVHWHSVTKTGIDATSVRPDGFAESEDRIGIVVARREI